MFTAIELISAAATIVSTAPTIVKALSNTPQLIDRLSKEVTKQIDVIIAQTSLPTKLIESDKASREHIRRFKELNDYKKVLLAKIHEVEELISTNSKAQEDPQDVLNSLNKAFSDAEYAQTKLNQLLKKANLNTESFVGWDLQGIDLSEADIRNCNFKRANLAFSNLGEAKIEGADFSKAILLNASRKGLVLSESLLTPLLKYLQDAPTTPEVKELLLKTAKSTPNKIGNALHKEMITQKVRSVENATITPKDTHLFLKKFYEKSDKIRKAVCELERVITEIAHSINENTNNYTSLWRKNYFDIPKLQDLILDVSMITSFINIKSSSKFKVIAGEGNSKELINGLEKKLKYIQKYYPYAQAVLNTTYKYYTTVQEDHTQDFEKPFLAVIKEQIKLLSRLYPEFEQTHGKYCEISTYVNRCIRQMLDYDKPGISEEKLANNSRIVFIEDHTHDKPSSIKPGNKVASNIAEDDDFCMLNVSMAEPRKPTIPGNIQGQIDNLKKQVSVSQEVKEDDTPQLDMSFAALAPNPTTPAQAQIAPPKPSTTLSSASAENAAVGEVKKDEEKPGVPQPQSLSKRQQKKQAAIGK
jgi:hypothetical protein